MQRRIVTQQLRDCSSSEGEGEGEGGEEGDAPLGRADQWDEAEMPTLMSGQQYTVPKGAGNSHGNLRGWKVMAVFERELRGTRNRLLWYDGFIFDTRMVPGPDGATMTSTRLRSELWRFGNSFSGVHILARFGLAPGMYMCPSIHTLGAGVHICEYLIPR